MTAQNILNAIDGYRPSVHEQHARPQTNEGNEPLTTIKADELTKLFVIKGEQRQEIIALEFEIEELKKAIEKLKKENEALKKENDGLKQAMRGGKDTPFPVIPKAKEFQLDPNVPQVPIYRSEGNQSNLSQQPPKSPSRPSSATQQEGQKPTTHTL